MQKRYATGALPFTSDTLPPPAGHWCSRCVPGCVLTVLGFVLRAVVLQLLAAAVAALSGLQRLFEQTLRFHDGGGFFLRQQDVRRGTAAGEEEGGGGVSASSRLTHHVRKVGASGALGALGAQEQRISRGCYCHLQPVLL